MSTFLANGNPIFSIGPGNLPKNPPGWMILYIFIFDIIILQKPYKELSISSWLINDFNFSSCEPDSFAFTLLYCILFIGFILK